jgi:oxygen-independent coproporphyrinogen-3 oxidase
LAEDWRHGGFGVYVHWPFCAAKCPYCDFNSHVRRDVDQDRMRRALVSEVRATAAEVPGRTVDTVFFGGGTPSLMPPDTVAAVLEAVADGWDLVADAEVTLEANPTSVEADRFHGYRDAGVNRLSLGVQALDDGDLRALGRMHSVDEAMRAFELARTVFPRVSFDLIYARQGQSLAAWCAELEQALAMAIDHLSLYQLTIEAGTRFGDLAERGRLRDLPDAGLAADMYLATQDICGAAGMDAYEVSNHAGPGAESRHNLVYWRYGDFAGVGAGAHGRLTRDGIRRATTRPRDPAEWLTAAEAGRAPVADPVDGAEQAVEMAMMGLRLREGIDRERYSALAGHEMDPNAVTELVAMGLLAQDGTRLRATDTGRPVLDGILERLL